MQTTARGETESGPFTPPRPERFAEHLQRCELKAPSPLVIWAPLLAMVFLVIIAGAMGNLIGILLPWLALGGLVLFHVVRMRYLRELERRGQRVQELIVLRRYPETLREGWRLLPQVRSLPVLHTGAIAAMTQALGELGEHESAMVGYGALIDELPEDHPSLPAVRLSRAMAALHTDQLADADDAIRRMRHFGETDEPTLGRAVYTMARLFQSVCTRAIDDAGELIDDALIDKLRPLGIEAGYGYALAAWVCLQRARRQDVEPGQREQLLEQMRGWWRRATLLQPASALVHRYALVCEVVQAMEGDTDG